MKKISCIFAFTLIMSEASFGQSVTIDPNSSPSKRVEINSGVPNITGLKLTQAKSQSAQNNPIVGNTFANINSVTGLTFDIAGNLYATGFSDNSIYKIAPDGTSTLISSGIFIFNNLHDITLGPDGNLYIANYTGNTVIKMTLSPSITFQNFASGFSNPIGLTFDPAGNLYVTNAGTGNISKVNSSGTVISHSWASGFSSPYNCVYSSSTNKIYVSNYGADEVAEVSLAGGAKTTFKSGVNFCTGITVDASGNLFVAQASPNKVSKITPAGVMTDYVATNYPFDLTFDNAGNLYIANQVAKTVSKASPKFSSVLMVNDAGDVVANTASNGNGWIETADGLKNAKDGYLTVNSQPALLTNALFGTNGTGISLQKNWPGIGYNSYRDITNTQRYMANGFAMVTAVDQGNGIYFWNKMGSGSANGLVGSNEQFIMGLSQAGNLGIGTSPDAAYRLAVNGTTRSKEVIVETGWADYVFEENYKLRSIDEMEVFIKENKHLPNIPKASDIEKNGLKLGETNKAMMEKIEELALYIIQLKKEIDILKSKN